jgi:hypothetical protein
MIIIYEVYFVCFYLGTLDCTMDTGMDNMRDTHVYFVQKVKV